MPSRRDFLRTGALLAGATVAGAAVSTTACSPDAPAARGTAASDGSPVVARLAGFRREQLDALADVVLPDAIGPAARAAAIDAFVTWADGYDPVAEEMHGYGYADVRYLPPDPAPAWRAQLDGLDVLAQRTRTSTFAALDRSGRTTVVTMALRRERGGDRLPAPLGASHIAIALLSHWASSPAAWNLALGVQVSPISCRPLGDALTKPLPVLEPRA